jgi:hypothetical protein
MAQVCSSALLAAQLYSPLLAELTLMANRSTNKGEETVWTFISLCFYETKAG